MTYHNDGFVIEGVILNIYLMGSNTAERVPEIILYIQKKIFTNIPQNPTPYSLRS